MHSTISQKGIHIPYRNVCIYIYIEVFLSGFVLKKLKTSKVSQDANVQ